MKKLEVKIIAFVLCICMAMSAMPLNIVRATDTPGNGNPTIDDNDDGDDDTTPNDEGGDTGVGGDETGSTPDEGGDRTGLTGGDKTGSTPDEGGDETGSTDNEDGTQTSNTEDDNSKINNESENALGGTQLRASKPRLLLAAAPTPDGRGSGLGAAPGTGEHGSGSYQLNEQDDHYRFYTEYYVKGNGKSITSAGVTRRTSINVYAFAGEIILFGSSVANSKINVNNESTDNVTGDDIVITTPGGNKKGFNVLLPGEAEELEGGGTKDRPNGLGYIQNRTQEKNGPMVNNNDEGNANDYYVPLQYHVETDGVYTFEFHSVTGINPGTTPKPVKVGGEKGKWWDQGDTSVAAWDVTVLGKKTETKWEVKSGRAWADYLALTTAGSWPCKADLDVHVLTHDGYQYNVKFDEALPFGFIFFANNTGFMSAVTDDAGNTSYRPIYHSFYDSSNDLDNMSSVEGIYLHKPDEVDTETQETYKIFFNAPNKDLNGKEYVRKGRTERIITTPIKNVTITDLGFNVDSHKNIARTGHGGYFTFTAEAEAEAEAGAEAMLTIRLDLRQAISNAADAIKKSYKGSGIVEITAPIMKGYNSIYWDGKDTDGIVIPAGIYGNGNVILATEVKHGEIHFPTIDMEGLYGNLKGGLKVKRLDPDDPEKDDAEQYNLYYNNNPLVYGNIEGNGQGTKFDGAYYVMSDGTKSYKPHTDRVDNRGQYFKDVAPSSISTIKQDDKEYLAKKLFNKSFSQLDSTTQESLISEMRGMDATFHHEPANSKETSMWFKCDESSTKYKGGGDMAGIDAWTYYTQGVTTHTISFAIMDTNERGIVTGEIFYDELDSSGHPDSAYSATDGDYMLSGIKVRLIDSDGKPLVHKERLPKFDETGRFVYDSEGKIQYEDKDIKFETVTDSSGTYRFTGVPYSNDQNITYYVQVMLSDVQSEVMRYTCTTSQYVKENFKDSNGNYFITADLSQDSFKNYYGADGNEITDATDDPTKIYRHKYKRDKDNDNDIVFKKENAQSVTFTPGDVSGGALVVEKKLKQIGFGSTVPKENQKDYKVIKKWDKDAQGLDSHQFSDGLTVELWVWNDNKVQEVDTHGLTRRTGALVDTQVLKADPDNPDKGWQYTWHGLDDRLQYYVLEYYTKKKPDGEVIYNDKGEPRMVLIGGTMPIFSADQEPYATKGIYGFQVQAGDYPETIVVDGETRIPIQKFGDGKSHSNALTDQERLESVDNNARQYNVSYTLTKEGEKTNVITMSNSQVYDDRAYYVWLGHETDLPNLIALTYVNTDKLKDDHAAKLYKDVDLGDGKYTIKGLSISSVDSATNNTAGNETQYFYIKEDGKTNAYLKATKNVYETGTGTRTHRVKYVVDANTKEPVSVVVKENSEGEYELVAKDNGDKVEKETDKYIVYNWYMTVHVYNLEPDKVIEYDPADGPITLQEALAKGTQLEWKLIHDPDNPNKVVYKCKDGLDTRNPSGILMNDTYRLPLYKNAVHPDMGTCADLVGIAYAEDGVDTDISKLKFVDTYDTRFGNHQNESDIDAGAANTDGEAKVQGSGGEVSVKLNTERATRINRVQDHANYSEVKFTPTQSLGRASGLGEDVFFYKVVIFSEDVAYKIADYNDIDATNGVVMYTYFTMKNKNAIDPPTPPEPTPTPPSPSPSSPSSDGSNNNNNISMPVVTFDIPNTAAAVTQPTDIISVSMKVGEKSPKTGDNNNLILWICIAILAIAIITVGLLRRKIKLSDVASIVMCVVGIVLLVYALTMFISQVNDYTKSSELYDDTKKIYVQTKPVYEAAEIADESSGIASWESLVDVDVSKLREENEDIVGWIYFENEDISYPVLHTTDDETYLRKTYTGEKSSAGSIFMEGKNNGNFSDAHTIIYGHNMKNLSMFGKLRYYAQDDDYINGHEYFQIITENRKLRYKIFSYKVVEDDSDVYTVYRNGGNDFLNFVNDVVKKGSYLDSDDESANDNNHLITLSTCFNDDRFVVTAVRCGDCIMLN